VVDGLWWVVVERGAKRDGAIGAVAEMPVQSKRLPWAEVGQCRWIVVPTACVILHGEAVDSVQQKTVLFLNLVVLPSPQEPGTERAKTSARRRAWPVLRWDAMGAIDLPG
jgi:hypothetical protein